MITALSEKQWEKWKVLCFPENLVRRNKSSVLFVCVLFEFVFLLSRELIRFIFGRTIVRLSLWFVAQQLNSGALEPDFSWLHLDNSTIGERVLLGWLGELASAHDWPSSLHLKKPFGYSVLGPQLQHQTLLPRVVGGLSELNSWDDLDSHWSRVSILLARALVNIDLVLGHSQAPFSEETHKFLVEL